VAVADVDAHHGRRPLGGDEQAGRPSAAAAGAPREPGRLDDLAVGEQVGDHQRHGCLGQAEPSGQVGPAERPVLVQREERPSADVVAGSDAQPDAS